MKTEYFLVDPTRNITILVDAAIPIAKQPQVAETIMRSEPVAEQTGFISIDTSDRRADILLRMAGGEFCGNATMSAAAVFCRKTGLTSGEVRDVKVGVSGISEPVNVRIEATDSGTYNAVVTMPSPETITIRDFVYKNKKFSLPMVQFGGITHLIAENLNDRTIAEEAVKIWCKELGVTCLGIMLLDREQMRLDPLVYVSVPETCMWESSCASGTTAVGAYLAGIRGQNEPPIKLRLTEPGGDLTIEEDENGRLKLGGHVRILKNDCLET